VVCSAVGVSLYLTGDFEEADRWLAESVEHGLRRERWETAARALAFRSLVACELGRIDQQTVLAEQSLELAMERDFETRSGETFVAMGASLAGRKRFDEALPHLEHGLARLRANRHPRAIADALIRTAQLLRAVGRPDDASEAIAEARSLVDSCVDPGILAERLTALERPPRSRSGKASETLSDRELTILRMFRGTLSERDIGRELYLSHNTIHSHAKSIYRKLGVSSRSEAVGYARERNLI
jgi:LuxR family transcriptional regulator, maltose regulon positive regulatory protein